MMSIVFGGIILTIVFGGAERLFFGGRTLKRGTLLSLFAALLFTISPVVSVFGRAVSVPTVIYVFVSVAVGFYRGSGLDRLFLTYVSVLVGVFLYFYGEAKSVSLFSSDIFYSANGVLLEVALTVFWQKRRRTRSRLRQFRFLPMRACSRLSENSARFSPRKFFPL